MTNVLNPKVAAFYLSFLPQFISQGDHFAKPLLLAAIHIGFGILWLSTLILLINRLRSFLAQRRNKAAMEAGSGLVLIGLGARLALERSTS